MIQFYSSIAVRVILTLFLIAESSLCSLPTSHTFQTPPIGNPFRISAVSTASAFFQRDAFSREKSIRVNEWAKSALVSGFASVRIGLRVTSLLMFIQVLFSLTYAALGIRLKQDISYAYPETLLRVVFIVTFEEIFFRIGGFKFIRRSSVNVIQAALFAAAHYLVKIPGTEILGLRDTPIAAGPILFIYGLLWGRTYRDRGFIAAWTSHFLIDFTAATAYFYQIIGGLFGSAFLIRGIILAGQMGTYVKRLPRFSFDAAFHFLYNGRLQAAA